MAGVKWVKITTDMFDNRKIKRLRKEADGNNLVLIWVMLITMAGRCNAGGMIFLTENIPYTPRMLAEELDFNEATINAALQRFEQLGMIMMNGCYLTIHGWEEYQNVEGLDRIREQTKKRVAAHRERKKTLPSPAELSRYSNVTVTHGNAIEEELDIKKKKEDIEGLGDSVPESAPPPKPAKAIKHKYGQYKNVLLTDEEYAKLQAEFPDYEERIERLSGYIASTGKRYKNFLATIRNWAKKDEEARLTVRPQPQPAYKKATKAEEMNDFYDMAANWANQGGNER